MNATRLALAGLILTGAVLSAGCASSGGHRRAPLIGGDQVMHVVLLKMKSPSDAPAAQKDAVEALSPLARRITPGRHLELGRPEVDGAYDVAFLMEFDSPAQYRAYLDSEAHRSILQRWRTRVESLRAFDITPSAAR